MTKTTFLILFTAVGALMAASDPPPIVEDYGWLAITRVATSIAYAGKEKDDVAGFDFGDSDPAITNRYGGRTFEFGQPLDVEIYLSNPHEGSDWTGLFLEYTYEDTPSAHDWIRADSIVSGLKRLQGRRTAPFRHIRPTQAGAIMIRVYAITSLDTYTAIPDVNNITIRGDGASWLSREVVGVEVREETRPGELARQ